MQEQFAQILNQARDRIASAHDSASLYQIKTELTGKSGSITALSQQMKNIAPELRRDFGLMLNECKNAVEQLLLDRQKIVDISELNAKLAGESLDLTLPTDGFYAGKIHPISQTIEEIIAIFGTMGFTMVEGPEIETDWYNFTALNIPPSHPARQMQDSFYMDKMDGDGNPYVLRTHTSPVQIRGLMERGAPIRIIAPGRTYRSDSDMTHTPMFHQVEGLVVDKKTNFGHLKGCLQDFCSAYFEIADVPLRFRPSYFPFTEPSAEVDIGCTREGGTLKIGHGKDWLEILGSGMIHPKVLANAGLDPDEWQGFAFGMGIERITMLKYGIPDLRTFFDGDQNWIRHFGFAPWQNPCLLRSLVA